MAFDNELSATSLPAHERMGLYSLNPREGDCYAEDCSGSGIGSEGIGHTSCILAQRPGMGVMLNTQGEPRDGASFAGLSSRCAAKPRCARETGLALHLSPMPSVT